MGAKKPLEEIIFLRKKIEDPRLSMRIQFALQDRMEDWKHGLISKELFEYEINACAKAANKTDTN